MSLMLSFSGVVLAFLFVHLFSPFPFIIKGDLGPQYCLVESVSFYRAPDDATKLPSIHSPRPKTGLVTSSPTTPRTQTAFERSAL
jgi:hypothetical protein